MDNALAGEAHAKLVELQEGRGVGQIIPARLRLNEVTSQWNVSVLNRTV